MPKITFRDRKVSDKNLRAVLDRVIAVLNRDIEVILGDRDTLISDEPIADLHRRRRAAGFTIKGLTLWGAFTALKRNKAAVFDRGKRYQVTLFGRFSETGTPQLHISRFDTGDGIAWVAEGVTADAAGRYRRIG